jgi:hypothetical protein
LRGRVQDSHHSVGGYLPSYLGIGALLHKVNCKKEIQQVNPFSLSPVKTTIVIIWALKRILTVGFRKYGRQ